MKKIFLLLLFFVQMSYSSAQTQTCIDSLLIRPFCPCPMIYAPVCACNGIVYSNDCLAQCDGNTNWGPVNPNLVPGDSCSLIQPLPPCKVEISGDSIACNFPSMLYASPSSISLPLVNYKWYNQINPTQILSTNQFLSINTIGIYCVSAEDSSGCIDNKCFKVSVGQLKINTTPDPPNICLGDSIILELKSYYTNYNWSNGKQTNIIKESPSISTKYFVEATDSSGCINFGEVIVNIDSCKVSSFDKIKNGFMFFPNPSSGDIKIFFNLDKKFNLNVYDISGKLIKMEKNLSENYNLHLKSGFYILEINYSHYSVKKNIIVR